MKRSWLRSCTHEAGHLAVALFLGMRVRDVEIYWHAQIDRHTGQRILGRVDMDTSTRYRWRLRGNTWEQCRVDQATHSDDLRLLGLAGSIAEMILLDGVARDDEIVKRVERRMSKSDKTLARGYHRRDVLRVAELIRDHRAEINAEALRIFKNTARERTRG